MTISKTFCPAKWDELTVNLSANYVYSCCQSEPIKITKKEDITRALDQQKNNLLEGIQDPACDYCWKVENQGYNSLRHDYLNTFDSTLIDQYKNNTVDIKRIEVNLGNECNFQCTYCNPKFSSQWESDVKNKPYKIYSDRFFYAVDEKNNNNINDTIDWLNSYASVDILKIIGGEPLQNKHFFRVIGSIKSNILVFHTNLSCKKNKLDNILNLAKNYKEIVIGISLDSTGKNAEFSRYGMDFNLMLDNIRYLITRIPPNIKIQFVSVMSSITIRDFNNMSDLIDNFYNLNPTNISWHMVYCQNPLILSLDTLPDQYKSKILEKIALIKDRKYINGLEILESGIRASKFNKTLYGQMKHFLEEFSSRKNIAIPVILD